MLNGKEEIALVAFRTGFVYKYRLWLNFQEPLDVMGLKQYSYPDFFTNTNPNG